MPRRRTSSRTSASTIAWAEDDTAASPTAGPDEVAQSVWGNQGKSHRLMQICGQLRRGCKWSRPEVVRVMSGIRSWLTRRRRRAVLGRPADDDNAVRRDLSPADPG